MTILMWITFLESTVEGITDQKFTDTNRKVKEGSRCFWDKT